MPRDNREKKEDIFQMRDMFNSKNVFELSQRIKKNYSTFNDTKFNKIITSKLPSLSLMERIMLIQNTLEEFLPKDFEQVVDIILKSQLEQLANDNTDNYPADFIAVPQSGLITKLGCNSKYFDLSMRAQKEMTKRFSCEWSIHDFIEQYEDESFEYLLEWAKDENCHVRRLCSEGIRPRLPWSRVFKKFQQNPSRLFEILDLLYFDNIRYVTRSVCNCLNDIAKTHPSLVINALRRWEEEGKQNEKEFEWMKKHALRTLIKAGNPEALEFLGFKQNPQVNCSLTINTSIVHLGESMEFNLEIIPKENSDLLIDYHLHFVKANGKLSSKVFKLKTLKGIKNKKIIIVKKHPLRKMSTRVLYPGTHYVEIQINGKTFEKKSFEFES